jgi:hypothetical protein
MRTTVTIDDQLLTRVKVLAAGSGRSVGSVIEDALHQLLDRAAAGALTAPVVIPVSGDVARPPLVDILDADALAAALGDDEP